MTSYSQKTLSIFRWCVEHCLRYTDQANAKQFVNILVLLVRLAALRGLQPEGCTSICMHDSIQACAQYAACSLPAVWSDLSFGWQQLYCKGLQAASNTGKHLQCQVTAIIISTAQCCNSPYLTFSILRTKRSV